MTPEDTAGDPEAQLRARRAAAKRRAQAMRKAQESQSSTPNKRQKSEDTLPPGEGPSATAESTSAAQKRRVAELEGHLKTIEGVKKTLRSIGPLHHLGKDMVFGMNAAEILDSMQACADVLFELLRTLREKPGLLTATEEDNTEEENALGSGRNG